MTLHGFLASLFTFLSILSLIHNMTTDLDDLPPTTPTTSRNLQPRPQPSNFHVKNCNVAHHCDGHTTQHQCTWKRILVALVTLLKNILVASARFLPITCSSSTQTKTLPRFFIHLRSLRLLVYNLIARMSSNHGFTFFLYPKSARAKLKMKKRLQELNEENNDSKLREFVDLSRHMHSPTRKMKF